MFWVYIRLVRGLPMGHHLVVLVSTLAIPVGFELVRGLQDTGPCLSCVNWGELALYGVFYQIAMLLMASATRHDRTRVEKRLDRTFSELTDRIDQLSEEQQRQITGIEDRVGDLREWVRDLRRALSDELGVALPTLAVSARMTTHVGAITVSINATADDPVDWRPRIVGWVKRQARNIRRWTRKILVDLEER